MSTTTSNTASTKEEDNLTADGFTDDDVTTDGEDHLSAMGDMFISSDDDDDFENCHDNVDNNDDDGGNGNTSGTSRRRSSRQFDRKTPSRAVSASEHPDFDMEETIVEVAAVTLSETTPSPSVASRPTAAGGVFSKEPRRRRRHRPTRGLRTGHEDEEDDSNSNSHSQSQSHDNNNTAKNATAKTTRRVPSRNVSVSEHPDFDVEAIITEAAVVGPPTPSTAAPYATTMSPRGMRCTGAGLGNLRCSISEHPDFETETIISEATAVMKPAATAPQSPPHRRTPSRAVSMSEHPDFGTEAVITEAKTTTMKTTTSSK